MKRQKLKYMLFALLLCGMMLPANAQEVLDSVSTELSDSTQAEEQYFLYYYRNGIDIKDSYLNNAELIQRIKKVLSLSPHIDSVKIYAYASPEGAPERNNWLAKKRVEAAREFILANVPSDSTLSAENIYVYPMGENWDELKTELERNYFLENREEVLEIINSDIPTERKKVLLKALDNNKTYEHIIQFHMLRLRIAKWVCIYQPTPEIDTDTPQVVTYMSPIAEVPARINKQLNTDEKMPPDTYVWSRIHIKTNAIGLGLGIANLAAEFEFNEHWSATLPVYYSSWDYFKPTMKFRTLAIQPEVRYWFSEGYQGLFTGAHLGMTYFNFAFDGDYRYQDKDKDSPALGGGISVGYRLPISKNKLWALEFTLGAGVYSLQYDKFYNTDNFKDGLRTKSVEKAYWGIDQAAITLSYAIELRRKIKKGGAE